MRRALAAAIVAATLPACGLACLAGAACSGTSGPSDASGDTVLHVTVTGSGYVTDSTDGGLHCTSASPCTATYPAAGDDAGVITLTPVPAPGWQSAAIDYAGACGWSAHEGSDTFEVGAGRACSAAVKFCSSSAITPPQATTAVGEVVTVGVAPVDPATSEGVLICCAWQVTPSQGAALAPLEGDAGCSPGTSTAVGVVASAPGSYFVACSKQSGPLACQEPLFATIIVTCGADAGCGSDGGGSDAGPSDGGPPDGG